MINIRKTIAEDVPAILDLYSKAFPDEDLVPLVTELLQGEVDAISLAARDGAGILGHIIFTTISGPSGEKGALLGPLAVSPDHQRKGVGSQLINSGFEQLTANCVQQAFVLGDPEYYSRFGFSSERKTLPPYKMPEPYADAWQSKVLNGASAMPPGRCGVPSAWMKEELWLP